jgi:hypothetical protein
VPEQVISPVGSNPDTGTQVSPGAAGQRTQTAARGFSFHDFLSAINPLQYIPVVGSIYRAATGDVIPEALQRAGSLLFSGLLGGPVGVITSIATTIAEKATGIDPDRIIAAQLHPASPPVAARNDPPPSAPDPSNKAASSPLAMTQAQLAAYGVRTDASGNLSLGTIKGADVLNTIELGRQSQLAAAYAANQSQPS